MEFNRTSRKAIALLVLVFALGIALGAVGHMLAERRVLAQAVQGRAQGGGPGGQPQGRLVGRLTNDLKLTGDQQKQITQILADMQHSYDMIREQMGPQFDQARNEGRDRMRQVLTPEQRPGFEDFLRKVDDERSKRGPDQYRPSGQRR